MLPITNIKEAYFSRLIRSSKPRGCAPVIRAIFRRNGYYYCEATTRREDALVTVTAVSVQDQCVNGVALVQFCKVPAAVALTFTVVAGLSRSKATVVRLDGLAVSKV